MNFVPHWIQLDICCMSNDGRNSLYVSFCELLYDGLLLELVRRFAFWNFNLREIPCLRSLSNAMVFLSVQMSILILLQMSLQIFAIILSIASVCFGLLIIVWRFDGKSPIAIFLRVVASKRCSKSFSIAATSLVAFKSNFRNCFVNFSTILNFMCWSHRLFWHVSRWSKVSSRLLQKQHLVFMLAYKSGRCFFLLSKVGSSELMNLNRKQLSACSLIEVCFFKNRCDS